MVKEGKSRAPVIVILVVCLVLLPVFYVLSIGPACWLVMNGYVSPAAQNFVYTPLDAAMDNCQPFRDFVIWYTALFIEG